MIFKGNLIYSQNWNIGFAKCNAKQLLSNRRLGEIQWMQHEYNDRFFADPFIYDLTASKITVFVEEYEFGIGRGRIVELLLDRKSKQLMKRYVLLDQNTHLSYPAFIRKGNCILVYPENGASGTLNFYTFDKDNHKLILEKEIINEALVDATIFDMHGEQYMIATKFPKTQENAYLYKNVSGNFKMLYDTPIVEGRHHARQGGNIFEYEGLYYRPAQNCEKRYGSAISVIQFDISNGLYTEKFLFDIKPKSFKYNLGLHTLNFYDDICVIDGYGYLHPFMGRFYNMLRYIKHRIIK